MTDIIKKSLKERCKLTKFFYKNGQRKVDHDKVLEKSEECTKQILEAKKNYILKMTKKLADSNTSSKSYWTILNRLLYNKKLPTIPPLLVDGKLVSDFCKKANIVNNFLFLYAHLEIIQAACRLFHIEQGAGSNPFMLLKTIY